MKKIISLFLVVSMVMLVFAACAGNPADGTTAASTTAETTSASTTAETTASSAVQSTTQTTATTQSPDTPALKPDSLIFHLDFSPESLEDGKYKDLSGNGHDGVVYGNVTCEDGSAKFTGDASSYVSIPDHADLNFTGGQSFTLEVRFKAELKSQWACIAQKGLGDNNGAYFGFWLDSYNKLNMGAAMVGTKNFASNTFIDSEWHQAIIIQDAKSGTILFYLDGELQSSTFPKNNKAPVEPMFLSSNGEPFTIGTNFSDHFTGLIDYVKLYNYAVPEKDLLTEYPDQVFNLERKYYDYIDAETGESFTLPYRIYYPTGYAESTDTKYPVMLMMHGHGECGSDNVGQLRNNGGHIEGLMAQNNCIIIAPQCQCDNGINKEWVASHHRFDETNRTLPEKATVALRALIALLDEMRKDPKVDTDKISAFGFSMGGFGVWELLIRRPDIFSAAVICSAAGAPASADKVLDIDIRAYHGKKDETVPYSGLELMDNAISALGGEKFTASYFDNADHNNCISFAFSQDGNFFTWLLEQTKAD